MWIIIIIQNGASAGGPLLILALALIAVLFLIPIVCPILAIKEFKEKNTAVGIFFIAIALIAAAYIIGSFIHSRIENKEYDRGSELLTIEMKNKENIDEETFSFSFNVTNNTIERIVATDIEMVVLNYEGKTLLTTTITDIDCDTGVSKDFTLTVKAESEEKTQELFYTDYRYLQIDITIKALDYNDRDPDDYEFNDHRVLKTADTVTLQNEYSEAISCFNAGDYKTSAQKFSSLGGYLDSMEKRKEALRLIEENTQNQEEAALREQYDHAVALYAQGKYAQAKEIFRQLGNYSDSADWVTKCDNAISASELHNAYIQAKALYEDKRYPEAYYAFLEISEYLDSADIMTEIVCEVERLSIKYADSGDYRAAFDILSDMGYSTSEGDLNYLPILKAYNYACYGDYKSAVRYGLTKIVLPEGCSEISPNLFEGCTGLTEVVMPDSVTKIGAYAFSGCSGMIALRLSPNIEFVGRCAFSNCDSLERIEFPSTLEYIELYGFNSFEGDIYFGGTVTQWNAVQKGIGSENFSKTVHCSDGDATP
ncbi:MAG: leucine-rich repeat protein [Clostridia bacterium]|nr:leucine-rich repeat protein [Clostridia bacterium]